MERTLQTQSKHTQHVSAQTVYVHHCHTKDCAMTESVNSAQALREMWEIGICRKFVRGGTID